MLDALLRDLTALPHRGNATPQGAEAARLLQKYLANIGATVHTESFQTPKTYVTIIYWLVGGLVAGLALVPVTGVAVGVVGYFILMAWRYVNGQYSFITKFPIQHTARNVIGRWAATKRGEAITRKVILVAHYDTAPASFLYSGKQQNNFRLLHVTSLVLMGLAGLVALLEAFRVGLPYVTYLRYGLMVYFLVQAVFSTLGYWLNGYTNGANDNATGVAAALATADRLWQAGLLNTEIDVVLTSAGEVGMIGAYYYVKAHKREWKRAQTLVINFDTLGVGKLTVIEQTGTVDVIRYKNEPTRLAHQLIESEPFLHRTQAGQWHTSNFDSVWFVRNRIPVLTLCALDENGRMPRINQPGDTFDRVETQPMETAVDLAESVVKQWVTES